MPTLLLLCFLTGPFGAPDEAAHFLRAVSVAQGGFLPQVSLHDPEANPSGRSAGGELDAGAAALAQPHLDGTPERRGDRFVPAAIRRHLALPPAGRDVYARHSNTAIYPPALYAASASAIAVARLTGAPVLLWFYAGRLANALVAAIGIWWALRRAREAAPFLLVSAAFPLTMFEAASLSADALLLAAAVLFAATLSRMAGGGEVTRKDTIFVCVATVVIGVGKVAYMPLALLPTLVAWLEDRRPTARVRALAMSLVTAIVLWAAWALVVRGKVFSIVPTVETDPQKQLAFVAGYPGTFLVMLARTAIVRAPSLVSQMTGRTLGWWEFALPYGVAAATYLIAVSTCLFADRPEPRRVGVVLSAMLLCGCCYLAALVFLYLQFTPVGAPGIAGAQGRYLLPLAIVLLSLTWRIRSPAWLAGRWPTLLALWCATISFVTLGTVLHRYWP